MVCAHILVKGPTNESVAFSEEERVGGTKKGNHDNRGWGKYRSKEDLLKRSLKKVWEGKVNRKQERM